MFSIFDPVIPLWESYHKEIIQKKKKKTILSGYFSLMYNFETQQKGGVNHYLWTPWNIKQPLKKSSERVCDSREKSEHRMLGRRKLRGKQHAPCAPNQAKKKKMRMGQE